MTYLQVASLSPWPFAFYDTLATPNLNVADTIALAQTLNLAIFHKARKVAYPTSLHPDARERARLHNDYELPRRISLAILFPSTLSFST